MANQYTVEKSGFRQMLKTFGAKYMYQLPSRKYYSETAIPRLYSSVREKVMEKLSSVEYFSGTSDLWSSVGLKPYISYTIDYIDDNGSSRVRVFRLISYLTITVSHLQ